MSQAFRFLIIPLILLVAGCYPLSSKYPLSNRASDSEILGLWQGDGVELAVTRSGRYKLAFKFSSTEEEADDPEFLFYSALTSRIEGKRFLSVMQVFPDEFLEEYARVEEISLSEARKRFKRRDKKMNGYFLGFYEIAEEDGLDYLTIYMMDDESKVVDAALADETLRGGKITVKNEDAVEDDILYLTSSSRTLTKFVAAHSEAPEELFDLDISRLSRIE